MKKFENRPYIFANFITESDNIKIINRPQSECAFRPVGGGRINQSPYFVLAFAISKADVVV